jgi:hypothetical protein
VSGGAGPSPSVRLDIHFVILSNSLVVRSACIPELSYTSWVTKVSVPINIIIIINIKWGNISHLPPLSVGPLLGPVTNAEKPFSQAQKPFSQAQTPFSQVFVPIHKAKLDVPPSRPLPHLFRLGARKRSSFAGLFGPCLQVSFLPSGLFPPPWSLSPDDDDDDDDVYWH